MLITPLIKGLKEVFPDATIDALVIPQTSEILKNNPYLNEIIIFNKKNKKLKAFFQIIYRLHKIKYSLAFLPHSSLTTSLLIYLAKIPKRIGFDRGIGRFLLTQRTPFRKNISRIEKNLDLLRLIKQQNYDNQTEIFFTDDAVNKAEKIIDNLRKQGLQKIICVAPGSIWFTKRWRREYYAILIKQLLKMNFGIVLIGSKAERELCETFVFDKNVINTAGKFTLSESAALISLTDLMICNDSGALHIANAVQTDVFAFFGPTVKSIGYFPFRKNDRVFEVQLKCRPCGSHGHKKCPLGHHNCMKLIKPEMVINQIYKKFEENKL